MCTYRFRIQKMLHWWIIKHRRLLSTSTALCRTILKLIDLGQLWNEVTPHGSRYSVTGTFCNTSNQIKTCQRSTDSKQKLLNSWTISRWGIPAEVEPQGTGWKLGRQQPQVLTREIPPGCEGMVEQERVQQVPQRDCAISILRDDTVWPSKALTEHPDPSVESALPRGGGWPRRPPEVPSRPGHRVILWHGATASRQHLPALPRRWINPAATKWVYKTCLFKSKYCPPVLL